MPVKEEELKQFVSEYLDIDTEKLENFDALKGTFETTFARKDVYKNELIKDESFIKPLIGKRLGSIETKVKQLAKDKLGLEFEGGDFKDKTIEEILELSTDKFKSKYELDLAEVKKNITSKPDEIVKEWEQKLNIVKEEANNWKTQATNAAQEFENFKTTLAEREKQRRVNENLENVFKSIKFAPEANELTIEGFKAKVLSEVKFDFDENDKFTTFDKEGKTIFNPKKNGVPYSPEEYVKDKAIEHKIFQLNPDGGKKHFEQKQERQEQPLAGGVNQKILNQRAVVE